MTTTASLTLEAVVGTAPYVLFYSSGDMPEDTTTWSVYSEEYTHPDAVEPIPSSMRWVATVDTEQDADVLGRLLQRSWEITGTAVTTDPQGSKT